MAMLIMKADNCLPSGAWVLIFHSVFNLQNYYNMKPITIIQTVFISASLGSLVLAGCKKPGDFGDTNTNPYVTTTPVTQNLLTGALRSLPSTTNGSTPALYAQHTAEIQYTDESRFLTINFDY